MFPLTLTQLSYFCTVVASNSVHEAAKKLHISQPSLSIALKTIENTLGIQLFKRDGHKLVLTEEGKFIYDEAYLLLSHSDNFYRRLIHIKNKQKKLRLGIAPMMSSFLIPTIFTSLKKSLPYIEFEIYESGVLRLQSLLKKQELDIAFLIKNSTLDTLNFTFHDLLNTEYYLYTGKESELANTYRKKYLIDQSINFTDYMYTPMIFYRETSYIQTKLTQYFKMYNAIPNILLRTNQIHTIKQLVSMSVASAFLTKKVVKPEDNLLHIPLTDSFPITIGIAYNKEAPITAEMDDFISFLLSHKEYI